MRSFSRIHTFDDAFSTISSIAAQAGCESVGLAHAENRILSKSAIAALDGPPFSRAMMDGFAVRWADLQADQSPTLQIIDEAWPGQPAHRRVGAGTAVAIATGAPIPEGADTVVRIEWCQVDGTQAHVLRPVKAGESVQPAGDDAPRGQELLPAGSRLDGPNLSICRAFGIHQVEVYKRPRVSVIVSGSELVHDADVPLAYGQIYSTNDLFLTAALQADGCTVQRVVIAPDNLEEITRTLAQAAADSDYVLTTGGASMGDHDFLPQAIASVSDGLLIEKVWMRPGSPFLAARRGDTVLFGLSGNPAASFIQFESLVRPAIRQALGLSDRPFPVSAQLAHDIDEKPVKGVRILRAQLSVQSGVITANARRSQSPGVLSSFGSTNGLLLLENSSMPAGSIVPARLYRPL